MSALATDVASPIAKAALEYAAHGLPVFPCHPATKHPLTPQGFKNATTDQQTIDAWWQRAPTAMAGMPTGEPSGVIVLDIDVDTEKGVDGYKALAALEAKHGPLPPTRAVRTPRGGEHRYFMRPGQTVKNSASKLGVGIDIRGDGGYVIVPPSVNADGVPYAWIRDSEPALAPDWLFQNDDAPKQRAKPAPGQPRRPRPVEGGAATRWAEAALDGELDRVEKAISGSRNADLNHAAFGSLISTRADAATTPAPHNGR